MSSPKIIDCEQNSEAWFEARKGLATASKMSTIMSSDSGRGKMPMRTRYLYALAGEIITGKPGPEGYKSEAMEHGHEIEAEARRAYALISDNDPKTVGLVLNDSLIKGRVIGASPDSLIGKDGALEIKRQQPDLLIHQHFTGGAPSEHLDQLQGLMWVCELKWIDLWIYWPDLPGYRRTVKRDENHIARLREGTESFLNDLDMIVAKVRKFGKA